LRPENREIFFLNTHILTTKFLAEKLLKQVAYATSENCDAPPPTFSIRSKGKIDG